MRRKKMAEVLIEKGILSVGRFQDVQLSEIESIAYETIEDSLGISYGAVLRLREKPPLTWIFSSRNEAKDVIS
ncbi:MAG: hypothetical protein ACI9BD_001573, partial [Candidatus Marinamargulisbacteria bacterium]